MDNQVTLSIIIPAYNCGETIEKTVNSVLAQQCSDYEIIIVNDGSADNTDAVCNKLAKNYPFIRYFSKENSGVSKTRNLGIKNATGKYVAFLDSDDLWDKGYYDQELNSSLLKGDADIFVFSCCFADLDGKATEYVHVKNEELRGGDYACGLFYHSFCSFIFKKSLLSDNAIEFPVNLKYGEDEVFRSKTLYLADRIIAEDKISFYYINNPYSSTKMNRNYKQYALQKQKAYYELKKFFFDQYNTRNEELKIKNIITVRYLMESFKLLCETGYGYKNLKNYFIEENIEELKSNNEHHKLLNAVYLAEINKYLSHPVIYYYKKRTYGFVHNTLGDIKHFFMRMMRNG